MSENLTKKKDKHDWVRVFKQCVEIQHFMIISCQVYISTELSIVYSITAALGEVCIGEITIKVEKE